MLCTLNSVTFCLHICFAAVLYAYEQCLLCYGHCAEIWYEAALYLQKASETGVSAYLQLLPHYSPDTLAAVICHSSIYCRILSSRNAGLRRQLCCTNVLLLCHYPTVCCCTLLLLTLKRYTRICLCVEL